MFGVRSFYLVCVFGFLGLAACSGGIAEFQLYDQAFDAQYEQGNRVLDRVAAAERIVVTKRRGLNNVSTPFKPDNAAYYLNAGDPPLTGAIRASLTSVQSYNKALSGLANGEAANALTARVGTLTSNLLTTASALQVAGAGTGVYTAAAQAQITALLPIFQHAVTVANRSEFRRQLLEGYPHVKELLIAMRGGTEEMLELIRRSYVRRGSLGGSGGIPASELEDFIADRKLMAGWVIMIDKTIVAMDAAAATAISSASTADIAALTEASIELRILAEKVNAAQTAN